MNTPRQSERYPLYRVGQVEWVKETGIDRREAKRWNEEWSREKGGKGGGGGGGSLQVECLFRCSSD